MCGGGVLYGGGCGGGFGSCGGGSTTMVVVLIGFCCGSDGDVGSGRVYMNIGSGEAFAWLLVR